MKQEDLLIQNLFREEFSRLVGIISKTFGLAHIELAEDIVSEAFMQATESWPTKGTPDNPSAWLYTVARQKALYHFRRNKILTEKVLPQVQSYSTSEPEPNAFEFSDEIFKDSQLQMMFAICHPAIASEAQIALALRILCGFGIDEIAEAFMVPKDTINKRLFRAKEKLRIENVRLELPASHLLESRLDNVLHIIYLLFSEGYYSAAPNHTLRKDFCLEAMRLAQMLCKHPHTNLPKVHALLALMCFHTSRFDARISSDNAVILYDAQDESLWNTELIERGSYYLDQAAQGDEISSYHIEAGIAFWHCQKSDSLEKWTNILQHYDLLVKINDSPGVALNRLYACYKAKGVAAALPEAEKLQLISNHFYYTLLGELYHQIDLDKALVHYQQAMALAKTSADQLVLAEKIERLKNID